MKGGKASEAPKNAPHEPELTAEREHRGKQHPKADGDQHVADRSVSCADSINLTNFRPIFWRITCLRRRMSRGFGLFVAFRLMDQRQSSPVLKGEQDNPSQDARDNSAIERPVQHGGCQWQGKPEA